MASEIAQLPNESSENKVVLNVQEKNKQMQPQPTITELSQDSIHQIVQGLQQAGGATQLPNRDIHTNETHLVQDEQTKPNFIPEPQNTNYIEEESNRNFIKTKSNKRKEQDRLDALYDELQMPVLIMILFFFFQLPYFQKNMMKFVPSLFNNDGNPSLSGYILKTALFGSSFYAITKLTKYLSTV